MNLRLFFLINLISLNSYAESSVRFEKVFEAWAKQTGVDEEVSRAGNAVRNSIPIFYRRPLEIVVIIVDSINKINQNSIEVKYTYEF